jgi:hypothetical protein
MACSKKKSYSRAKSKKFKHWGFRMQVNYASGSFRGEINEDQITLGQIIIPHQKFAEIMDVRSEAFASSNLSGILGLAYPNLSSVGFTPVFDSIIKNKLLKRNIISFYYSLHEKVEGQISVGFVDKSKFEGKLNYYKVIDKRYWTIKMDDIRYGGKSIGICGKKGCKALIDTGTSLMTGPSEDLRKLLSSIPIENDCTNYNMAEKLTIVFSGDEYLLDPDQYMVKTKVDGKDKCRALITPFDMNFPHGPVWMLGGIFLQNFYSVFDRDRDAVGFATAVHKDKATYDNY